MDDVLRTKLLEISQALDETITQMSDPVVINDQNRYRTVARRHAELKEIVAAFRRYEAAELEYADATEIGGAQDEPEMTEYLAKLAEEKQAEMADIELEIKRMLVSKDPNDEKDVIVEIRSAAGGDEAALWAADLLRMYERYAERHNWLIEALNTQWSDGGGIKETTFAVKGDGAYSRFKFEAGPHRVQRVPKTESQGRVHTSMATVAVLPEAEDVDVEIHENDLVIDVFRSSGPGGQSVNTTDSAVRITHTPSGIVVSCQDEKSQLQNKAKALRVLRARLYQRELDAQLGEIASARKAQVGSGERSEKIRTYNFKENRVSDHRVNLTLHNLPEILEGDLDTLHDALMADDEASRLAQAER